MSAWQQIYARADAMRRSIALSLDYNRRLRIALARSERAHGDAIDRNDTLQTQLVALGEEVRQLRGTLQSQVPEALRLLRMAWQFISWRKTDGELNAYELRCWLDDYRQFRRDGGDDHANHFIEELSAGGSSPGGGNPWLPCPSRSGLSPKPGVFPDSRRGR